MATIFSTWQDRKQQVRLLAEKAYNYGWIDEQRKQSILTKLENDLLTIGVIGQMKSGKSTFLNTFVFEDDILPAAVTPMTATLTVITYGERKKIVAEMYTSDEWAEQVMQAERSLEDVVKKEEITKIKAAKELVNSAKEHITSEIESLLGTIREDVFENLSQYVSAGGKYVSITKSVKIYYPNEALKGVQIVDTPGFNDPIVSREERTKEFLKNADVVLLMLYAAQPFNETDRNILFKHVRSCGIGKVIIGVNKYDMWVESGADVQNNIHYIVNEINQACEDIADNRLSIILEDTKPIPLSAQMALLSQLPMHKIHETEEYAFAFDRYSRIFEISGQHQFKEKSQIELLSKAVLELIEKEKGEILLRKPISAIMVSGEKRLDTISGQLSECIAKIHLYKTPDDQLENDCLQMQRAVTRLNNKIKILADNINNKMDSLERQFRHELEDLVECQCGKAKRGIDDMSLFTTSGQDILHFLDNFIETLVNRYIARCVESQLDKTKYEISLLLDNFFIDVNTTLRRYNLDYDQQDIVHEAEQRIKFAVTQIDVSGDPEEEENNSSQFLDFLRGVWNGFLGQLTFGVYTIIQIQQAKNQAKQLLDGISTGFPDKVDGFLAALIQSKERIVVEIAEVYDNQLLIPIQNSLTEVQQNINNRQNQLEHYQDLQVQLESERDIIQGQIDELNNFN